MANWRCNACGSVVTGVNWSEMFKHKLWHPTPTGGECYKVNFEKLADSLPAGTPVVTCSKIPDKPAPETATATETVKQE